MFIRERQVQLGANKLAFWADNDFKLSADKRTFVVFSRRLGRFKKDESNINLKMFYSFRKGPKFLCVVLHERLTFIPHIKHLGKEMLETLNIPKVLSHAPTGQTNS